jgi:hypothetical protein
LEILALDDAAVNVPIRATDDLSVAPRASRRPGFGLSRVSPSGNWFDLDRHPIKRAFQFGDDIYTLTDERLLSAFWEGVHVDELARVEGLLTSIKPKGMKPFQLGGCSRFLGLLSSRVADLGLATTGLHVLLQEGDGVSSTFDWDTGTYIGLHIDFMVTWGWENRHALDKRMVFNLGEHPRALVFVPNTLQELRDRLIGEARVSNHVVFAPAPTPEFVSLAMTTLKPRVFRIDLKPGSGVIFPAQNVVHDGYTRELTSFDVFLNCLVSRR